MYMKWKIMFKCHPLNTQNTVNPLPSLWLHLHCLIACRNGTNQPHPTCFTPYCLSKILRGSGSSLVAHLACVERPGISSITVFAVPTTWIVWGSVGAATGSWCRSLSPSTSSLTGASNALGTHCPATCPIRVYIGQPILQCSNQVLKVVPCYTVATKRKWAKKII